MGQSPPAPAASRVVWAIGLLAILISVVWWSMRSPVELSEHGYDLTIALYRVCNQRSEEGLENVEHLLNESIASAGAVDPSHAVVAAVIAQAKSGDWQAAARACRQALEDQVQR